MNADGEWNDSRQSLFSELIIRYGEEMNRKEYVQRGLAALYASFEMMYCPENIATKEQWKKYGLFSMRRFMVAWNRIVDHYGEGFTKINIK